MRSCYSSEWRLFRGSENRTAGRYAFAAPGTPHYPGDHYLGSLNWVTTDRDGANPPLGEWQRDARASGRPWHNGAFGGALPLPLVIGSAECLAQGETYPAPTSGRVLINGVDSRCWQHNPDPCGAGEFDGGGFLPYLPNSTAATELAGGGAVEPDEFLGATELDGGGIDLYGPVSSATELDGGGIDERSEGATELAGGGAVEPDGEDCGATELAGGGTSEGVSPGASCATAGVGTLGELVDKPGRPQGEDWYSFPATAGGNYHLDLVWTPGKGSVFVYTGTCAGLTTIGIHGFPGCYDYSGVSAGTTIYVRCLISAPTGADYSFTLDSGTC